MKSLLTILLVLILGFSTIFSQEKSLQSGNILFHTIDKEGIKANSVQFESKLDLSNKKISLLVPFSSFSTKSNALESKLKKESSASFIGNISANSEIVKEGRHIVFIEGVMTIMGVEKPFKFNGLLENKSGDSKLSASFLIDGAEFNLNEDLVKEFTSKIEIALVAKY